MKESYRKSDENLKRAQELLKRISYKPNFKMEIFSGLMHDFEIRLSHLVVDSREPDNIVNVFSSVFLNFDLFKNRSNEGQFALLIRDSIKLMEMHEIDEWLKLDGKHVNDPHPELNLYISDFKFP